MDAINLKPTLPELDARELLTLVEMYLDDKRRVTVQDSWKGYAWKLRHFVDWWEATGPTVDWVLTPDLLVAFGEHLNGVVSGRTGQRLGFHTRNDVLRRTAGFFTWAYKRGYTAQNWAAWIPKTEGRKPIKTALDLDDLARIYRSMTRTRTGTRDAALFAVLAGTGMRRGECAGLRIEDVDFEDDGSGIITVRQAKGRSERQVAFDQVAGRILSLYLDTLVDRSGPLWPGDAEGGRLHRHQIYRLTKRAAGRAHVDDFVGLHDIRRAFATFWVRKLPGVGYGQLLARQMGHTTLPGLTFSTYSLQGIDDVRRCMVEQRCSLLAQMFDQARAKGK